MLAEIEGVGDGLSHSVDYQPGVKIVTSRIDKVPFIDGFFIPETAVLAVMSDEEFNNL